MNPAISSQANSVFSSGSPANTAVVGVRQNRPHHPLGIAELAQDLAALKG